jgi:hypothetical protein
MVRRPTIVVASLIVGLGLAACSGSGSHATPAPTTPATVATTTTTVPSSTTTTDPTSGAADEGFATRDPFEPQG